MSLTRYAFVFIALSGLLAGQELHAQEYPKAVLRGDYPDPTIVRVGEDYYMTHSPFVYSPGFLIWHSKDLEHWEPVGRALAEQTGSAMAPDLVHYNGRFFIYYPAAGTNWVIWADDIRGPWSRPIDLKVGHIDPGHAVDENGKRYLFLSDGYVVPLSDDGLSVAGEMKKTYDGWDFPEHWITEGKWLESPKIVRKGDYYYLTTAEGGTAGPPTSHMVVSARSRSLSGPWENSPYNPIVRTSSADEYWWSKGHGTLIDDVNGNWWLVYHAYENGYHTLGRQTLIEPVQWTEDGWFRSVKRAVAIDPKGTPIRHGLDLSDAFENPSLGLQWTSWQQIETAAVELKEGRLHLKGKGTTPKDARLLLATPTDKSYEVQVEIDRMKGSTGGLVLFYSEKAFAGVSTDGKQFSVHLNADTVITRPNLYGDHVRIKIVNVRNRCDFLAGADGVRWDTLFAGLDVSQMHHNTYGGFYALRVGLMATGKGEVQFDNFSYQPANGYLFAYFTDKNNNTNGLHFAWSRDGYRWDGIGPEHGFLKSDYGPWGTEKKMRDPFLTRGPDGTWHCLWTINWDADVIGYASSKDLIHWGRQSYIPAMQGYEARNLWAPEMIYDEANRQYVIYWSSTIKEGGEWKTEPGFKYDHRIYYTTTRDFKSFTPARVLFDPGHNVIDATIKRIGGRYVMVYKDERELPEPKKNLLVAESETIEGPYRPVSDRPFTPDWVEGPAILPMPDSTFLVYMDAYRDHQYRAKRTRDFTTWEDVSNRITLPDGTKHGSIVETTLDHIETLQFEQQDRARKSRETATRDGVLAPKPLFRDPVYDGAADPVVIWNPLVSKWWMFYTNRRVTKTELPGVSWVFGTPIGIAESSDGAHWTYVGTADFGQLPPECGGQDATLWAPDVVLGDDGRWHMFLTVVPGIDVKWGLPAYITHLTSTDLRTWKYERRLEHLGDHVIDAEVLKQPDGTWRMYYKDSNPHSRINVSESTDLFTWSDPEEALAINGEGPIAFQWKGYTWLVVDTWNGQTVHRSKDGDTWEVQPGSPLLPDGEGTGLDDVPNALHANVVISNDRVYLFYFTHPGRIGADKQKDTYEQRRTSIQVVELELNWDGWLTADRNRPTYVQLFPPSPVEASIRVDLGRQKPISDHLFGVFFEDINYAADGGLYAELVQNRSFEYDPADRGGRDSTWTSTKSWDLMAPDGATGRFAVETADPVHANNPHYAVLDVERPGTGVGLANRGYDGIVLRTGATYRFSAFARGRSGQKKGLTVRLVGPGGEVLGEAVTDRLKPGWSKLTATIVAKHEATDARLVVLTTEKGRLALDVVSLLPEGTFNNRPNGLRADLAQAIADIRPRFVRFPGGCLVHGNGLGNMYRWKNTLGPIEQRVEQKNLWGYRQTAGLGYFEFFQFCKDLGAMPLPVLPAAVSCQNSADGGQKGLPLHQMDDYVQEVLDLVEFANGDTTTTWGKKRAEAGHPEPFGLKYLGIGNEDLISDTFEERFTTIYRALQKNHPEITVVGTAGPFSEGTDYVEGWKIADRLRVPVIDEHYYQAPGWFINNQDFYDAYPRVGSKVYLGEYASWGNTLYNALAEAAYMTGLERNGDVVSMASYAPLLAREQHTQWGTDLLFFNNREVKPTPNYYVQQLFGRNAGATYVDSRIETANRDAATEKRLAVSTVRDETTGDLILKLVNILPSPVNTRVLLDGDVTVAPEATRTVLSGHLDDRSARPETSTIPVGREFTAELPPHSLTVIRIHTR